MTDLDELMTRLDELDHTDPASWKDKDIDAVIAYQRKCRAQKESGVKPKRGAAPQEPLDLVKLGIIKAPGKIVRRI